ncbi:MAG: aldo/keto reductase [Pontimonas sp.]|nr:aldo/keto reductase [Pontimonas sp.]
MDDVSSSRMALPDGNTMPSLGLGVYKVPNDDVAPLVHEALRAGYRLIDTASMYGNEEGVGDALLATDVPREEITVATKFWMDDLGYEKTLAAAKRSLAALRLEYLDLYLIHWPAPQRDLYMESWRAMEKLKDDGLVRSIGVCNFHAEHLERVMDNSDKIPVINQVELHPWLTQEPLKAFHDRHGIVTQAWSPLARGQILEDSTVVSLASEYGVSVAQLVIRWHLQRGVSVIPKSLSPARIRSNAEVFGFHVEAEHMAVITALNRDYRTGVDPNDRN